MNETLLIWLFGGAYAAIAGLGVFALTISNRMTRMEAVMSLLVKNAARVLHSPHTPELDVFLEKLDSHQRLTQPEQKRLFEILHEIISDRNLTSGHRTLAAMIVSILQPGTKT